MGDTQRKVEGYALRMLKLMNDQADKNGVYTGFTTQLAEQVMGSDSNYSLPMRLLLEAGAIEQVRRGSGKIPSVWRIIDPKPDLSQITSSPTLVTKTLHPLEKRVKVLEDSMGTLNMKDVLGAMTRQMELQNAKIDLLGQELRELRDAKGIRSIRKSERSASAEGESGEV